MEIIIYLHLDQCELDATSHWMAIGCSKAIRLLAAQIKLCHQL